MQKYRYLSGGYSLWRNVQLVVLFVLVTGNVFSQVRSVSGIVTDEETGDPIPYVSIILKNTITGTITDTLGNFKFRFTDQVDTLRFSAIGFYPVERVLPKNGAIILSVKLKPETIDISEVQVAPDEGPIRELLMNIVKNKHRNNPAHFDSYSYRKYTKWEYHINHVSDEIINSKPFRNNQSVFKTAEDSSKYLPLYFSEQLVFNEIQKNPLKQKSTVLADRTQGVGILNELEISGFTSALDIEVNFYDNFINLFTQNFVSPIAENGWFYYKYFLADSAVVNNHMQYRVNFQPRRKGENTFKGYFLVEDHFYSLVEIDGSLSVSNKLNFLKSMHLKSNYIFVSDSISFYKRNQMDAVFDYLPFENKKKDKKRLSLFYTQTALVGEVTINPEKEVELVTPRATYETVKLPDAYDKDSTFWNEHRLEPLTQTELESTSVIDSIGEIKVIGVANGLANMSMTSYYDVGKIELGPFTSFFNTNKVEGFHLFMGARTSDEISKHMLFWGGLGYGFRNKKVNGIAGFGYKFPTINRQVFKISYDDKMIRHGENEKILYLYENAFTATENNLVSQVLKHDELDEIFREQKFTGSYEYEWYPGLLNKLTASYIKHDSPEFYPFVFDNNLIESVSAFEVNLDTRFSKEEKLIDNRFQRIYLDTKYPIVHLTVGAGEAFYHDESNWYGRVAATLKHEVYVGQSVFNYALEAGAYFGKLPYTMLDIPRGNETVGYYTYDFNMLNYLEYVHDKYAHAYLEYHLNGFLIRRVPLLRKTGWREVLSSKIMVGSLSDKHQQVVNFPLSVTKMENPYVELGAGVENILKMFRVEAIWRVTPASVVGAPTFGVRALFQLGL